MDFEVHTPNGQATVYEDFVEFAEAHYGLFVRAEHRHEIHVEAWGDIRVTRHVRRVFRGLKNFENESREVVHTHIREDGDWISLIKMLPEGTPRQVEKTDGAEQGWLKFRRTPPRARVRLDRPERGIQERLRIAREERGLAVERSEED